MDADENSDGDSIDSTDTPQSDRATTLAAEYLARELRSPEQAGDGDLARFAERCATVSVNLDKGEPIEVVQMEKLFYSVERVWARVIETALLLGWDVEDIRSFSRPPDVSKLAARHGMRESEPDEVDEVALAATVPRSVPARPSVAMDDGCVVLEDYPEDDSELVDGEVCLFTYEQGEIHLGAQAEAGERILNPGMYLTPGAAEDVAALLNLFAAKARAGEDWEYP